MKLESAIVHAEYIIKKFPKSSLSIYAHLYLNSMYALKAKQVFLASKNRDDAIKYLRLSKEYGFIVLNYKNTKMREIATTVLSSLELTLFIIYDYSPPWDLEQEFTFTFKH